ncbi:hypothetical protein BCR39DRAFT_559365 [Naematelia encephala]|uniref:Uncharacterized protein n=1 Tax=Naematelia encephala TaxID=71784 RepID=A0A1Y2B1V0_9TREE|nr:hypothetical protein BCR39DRAFT_559365 [Naematelia encephala]
MIRKVPPQARYHDTIGLSAYEFNDALQRLYSSVCDLSEQNEKNQAMIAELKARNDNIKGQAAHIGNGFPLRRFNLDISDEEFQSELEGFAAHLVLENQQLQNENKQLGALLKEYEGTLDNVMGKFRGIAYSSQQHDLSLHSYYTSLLQTLQTAHSSAQLHDDTSLSLLLTRLSTLLRSALRSMGGEEPDPALPGLLTELSHLANGGQPLSSSDGSSSPPSSPSSSKSKKSVLPRAPAKPTPFPGFVPGSTGGYAGTQGQGDWALEREMEIQRLENENRALRDMLGVSTDLSPIVEDIPTELPIEHGSPHSEQVSRKSSLTVEDLLEGAAMEQATAGRDSFRTDSSSPLAIGEEGHSGLPVPVPEGDGEATAAGVGTGLGGGGGITIRGRPLMTESVLGFSATPPEHVFEEERLEDGEGEGEGN